MMRFLSTLRYVRNDNAALGGGKERGGGSGVAASSSSFPLNLIIVSFRAEGEESHHNTMIDALTHFTKPLSSIRIDQLGFFSFIRNSFFFLFHFFSSFSLAMADSIFENSSK